MLNSYDDLFHLIQTSEIFPDSKLFVDCVPRASQTEIVKAYNLAAQHVDFDLKKFVLLHYTLPASPSENFETDVAAGIESHIARLWPLLTQAVQPETQTPNALDSLISLPHPYVVPGGRFREIYYWDSYFTMLGLKVSGEWALITQMVENFAHLITTLGYIPNGNRQYYLGRSQPPFFALMVDLLAEHEGDACYRRFLPQLSQEYAFWQTGAELNANPFDAIARVVRMPDGNCLNRYWDEHASPRPESYVEDLALVRQSNVSDQSAQYRHIRAGAESGWDFSSRWFRDQKSMAQIHTTDILPVDLNVLLVHLARTLAKACSLAGDFDQAEAYGRAADKRLQCIQKFCWDDENGFYRDYDFSAQSFTPVLSLAAVYPLFFQVATGHQARRVAEMLQRDFLQPGGLTCTLNVTGQQWDAPNGWAPLHWMAVQGLRHYGYYALAEEVKQRWIKLNKDVFERTGKLLEKYNVCDTSLEGGGGEYPVQDGFGWTNGVLLQFLKER